MQINSHSANNQTTLALQGRFDFHTHRDFRSAYELALEDANTREVVIDLGGVDYLDSSALGMLLLLRERAESMGKTVSLTKMQGTVKQVLDIANFDKIFVMKT
ncbi:MAG: STAS domain-containing protein [Hydrogenophilaceae bacterium]|nr:STAS domain-containing protein [Hydrogenophilaceae bacterium]